MSVLEREILYLHGLGSSAESKKGRLVRNAFGAPGHLVTVPDLNLPSFPNLAPTVVIESVIDLLDRFTACERIVIGSSFGAYIALHALAQLGYRAARMCTKLVLLAPVLDPWDPKSALISGEVASSWRQRGEFPLFYYPEQKLVPVHVRFLDELEQLGRAPSVHEVPTLVIHGARDEVVHFSQSERYSTEAPTARLVSSDDVHELMASPEWLVETIDSFLKVGISG